MQLGAWMVKRGIGFRELARQLGVSHVSVLRWTYGERRPSYENILKISKLTNHAVTFADFQETKCYKFR